jgi:hypothetical protein
MAKRKKLPDDLKELCCQCRAGKLFAVQQWIRDGRPCRMPAGNFATSPIRIAIEQNFHSLVEVLLQENVLEQEEKDSALATAVDYRNLDIVELLFQYGANPNVIDFETVLWSRHPGIMRWFLAHGLDLESSYGIAQAFRDKHREFLGTYLNIRDHVPTAAKQAAMALRYHAADGNLKWVSLLLWAGADPRLPVPRLDDSDVDEENIDSALAAAVQRGQFEVVKRIKIDTARDDVTVLANGWCLSPNPNLLEMLITLGADVRRNRGAINSAFSAFEWSLDPIFRNYLRTEDALQCMEILAVNGARWRPEDGYKFSCLRRTLAKVGIHDAIRYLQRIVTTGAIDQPVFQELMRTPQMRELLRQSYPGVIRLREYADYTGSRARKNRM